MRPALHSMMLLAVWLAAAASASAFEPTITKLLAKNQTASPANYLLGSAVALNDRWVLVGEPANAEPAGNNGAVHVYSPVTGRHLRRLKGSPNAGEYFGEAVAVSGDFALVGASFNTTGAAYVFDLRNGKLVRKIVPADAVSGDHFGCAVGLDGRWAVIGAFQSNAKGANSGAAYVFDIETGAQLGKLTGTDTAANDWFGQEIAVDGGLALILGARSSAASAAYLFDIRTGIQLQKFNAQVGDLGFSLALSGRRALVGSNNSNDAAPNGGAAMLFNCDSGALIERFTPNDNAENDSFGVSVALHGSLALIGARGTDPKGNNSGSVYLYDLRTRTQIAKLFPSDGKASAFFGDAAALYGKTGLVGAYWDSQLANKSGAAYLLEPLAGPASFDRLAAVKDSAAGLSEARYASFSNAFINADGEVIFQGTLTGPGAAGGKNRGAWSTLAATQSLDLLLQSNTDLAPAMPGVRATSILTTVANQANAAYFQARLAGAGVNAGNNTVLFKETGPAMTPVFRTGDSPPALGGGVLARFQQVLQTSDSFRSLAVVYRLRQGSGNVTASNDTGIFTQTLGGGTAALIRENNNLAGGKLGEITRASFFNGNVTFCARMRDMPAAQSQAVFEYDANQMVAAANVAIAGNTAPNSGGARFSAFLGETISSTEDVTIKATLNGTGVTAANRLGLWSQRFGPLNMVVRTGGAVPGLPAGVVWRQITRFWALTGDRVLFLATLAGPGITSANDQALVLAAEDNSLDILLREGDPAPGCGSTRVGVIQGVVADSLNNHYAVRVSLAGAPASSNQALLIGRASLLLSKKALRRPHLALRKGDLCLAPGGATSSIRSISWSNTGFDATGAGAKGLGQPVNGSGTLALIITMTDRSVQLATLPR